MLLSLSHTTHGSSEDDLYMFPHALFVSLFHMLRTLLKSLGVRNALL
jgi:hypothetical protein